LLKLDIILEDVSMFAAPDTDGIIFQADPQKFLDFRGGSFPVYALRCSHKDHEIIS
jgi:hypothetical protein